MTVADSDHAIHSRRETGTARIRSIWTRSASTDVSTGLGGMTTAMVMG
jgi:hypothetical protein